MPTNTKTTKRRFSLTPTDLPAALEALGVEVSHDQGDEVYALCPMHVQRVGKVDTKPSWSVNRETGLTHCFSCGYSSTFVGLVMDVLKVDMGTAFRWVKKNGLTLDVLDSLPGRLDPHGVKKKPERIVPESVFVGFVQPPEKAMKDRGVSAAACEAFGVLWDPDQKGWILPVRWPDGVLMGYQFKRGSVVLNEPKRMRKRGALFGVHAMEGRCMILVESPLDCLRLWTDGIKGAVSSFGAHVSDEQIRIITEYAESVIIALDNDPAGAREARRLASRLGRRMPTYLFNYDNAEALPGKKGKDPGELTAKSNYRGITQATFWLEDT